MEMRVLLPLSSNLYKAKEVLAILTAFAGFCIDLDELHVTLLILRVQNVVGHVVAAGGGNTARRNRESALRAAGVHCHDERITLEHILGDGGFHNKVLPIRQALHAEKCPHRW